MVMRRRMGRATARSRVRRWTSEGARVAKLSYSDSYDIIFSQIRVRYIALARFEESEDERHLHSAVEDSSDVVMETEHKLPGDTEHQTCAKGGMDPERTRMLNEDTTCLLLLTVVSS